MQLHAHHKHAEQWNSYHTVWFRFWPDTSGDIGLHLFRPNFKKLNASHRHFKFQHKRAKRGWVTDNLRILSPVFIQRGISKIYSSNGSGPNCIKYERDIEWSSAHPTSIFVQILCVEMGAVQRWSSGSKIHNAPECLISAQSDNLRLSYWGLSTFLCPFSLEDFQDGLNGWTELHKIWRGYSFVIAASNPILSCRYAAFFLNGGGSKASEHQ